MSKQQIQKDAEATFSKICNLFQAELESDFQEYIELMNSIAEYPDEAVEFFSRECIQLATLAADQFKIVSKLDGMSNE